MNVYEILKISLASILSNKIRTFLTILGIIIGIAAVIAMLSVGQGAQSLILQQVQGLGSNSITILPVANFTSLTSRSGLQSLATNKLDYKVVNLLENTITFPEITAVSPEVTTIQAASYKSNSLSESVYGVTQNFFIVREMVIAEGRAITSQDNDKNSRVAVLGPIVKAKLFGESNPIGQEIRIDSGNYVVVGVAAAKGSNFDERIYVPLNTATNTLIGNKDLSLLAVKVSSEELVDSVAVRMNDQLMKYFNVKSKDKANFTVFTSQDALSLTSSITGIFTTLLASIAGISLVVGGIGIMNIMLVSVSERTKEIGLRKAVGAKQRAILSQFLMESVVLTVLGGIIGIVVGISLAEIVSYFSGIPVILSGQSIVLATSVSVTIGIVFGFYPAYRAAQLNPIDALRYE